MKNQSDVAWEKWGQKDPYFGVLTDDKFRSGNIQQSKRQFFRSGEEHIANVIAKIENHFGPIDRVSCLDFGCGVGRLLLPLSQQFERVTGLDVSQSMLQEASKNLNEGGVSNVELLHSDDALSLLGERTFDFVHSFIVLQHIAPKRGYQIVSNLLSHLSKQGAVFLHVSFQQMRSASLSQLVSPRRFVRYIRTNVPFAYVFFNVLRGNPPFQPAMEMNEYDLGTILELFHQVGFSELITCVGEHGSSLTASFYSKRVHPVGDQNL